MTDAASPLAKLQGPPGSPAKFERQAKAFVHAGGAILFPHQLAKLTAATRAEIEGLMEAAYGKRQNRT